MGWLAAVIEKELLNKMDEPHKYYAEGKKADWKRMVPFMCSSRTGKNSQKLKNQNSGLSLIGEWLRGDMRELSEEMGKFCIVIGVEVMWECLFASITWLRFLYVNV